MRKLQKSGVTIALSLLIITLLSFYAFAKEVYESNEDPSLGVKSVSADEYMANQDISSDCKTHVEGADGTLYNDEFGGGGYVNTGKRSDQSEDAFNKFEATVTVESDNSKTIDGSEGKGVG